jgi:hypothetical protein
MIKSNFLPNALLTLLLTATAPALQAHPGHQHLEGAPGDMHLHAFLESPQGLLLLGVVVIAALGWGLSRLIRRRDRSPTRMRGQD